MTDFHLNCRSATTSGDMTLVQPRAQMKVLDLMGGPKETATCTKRRNDHTHNDVR